jgi:hypothetical protein
LAFLSGEEGEKPRIGLGFHRDRVGYSRFSIPEKWTAKLADAIFVSKAFPPEFPRCFLRRFATGPACMEAVAAHR